MFTSKYLKLQRKLFDFKIIRRMCERNNFVLPSNQPIAELECKSAFRALTEQEKLYAHYFSKASWYGSLIVTIQTSPESPLIFSLLHRILAKNSPDELEELAIKAGISQDDFTAFLVYCCGFFSNMGNYKGFGDSKIIPNLPVDKFETIIKSTTAFKDDPAKICHLFDTVKNDIFSLGECEQMLGFNDVGTTTYSNYPKEDANIVDEFLKANKIEVWNARTFKTVENGANIYEIKLASCETEAAHNYTEFNRNIFKQTRGDYSELLKLIVHNLEKANQFSSNENQKKRIINYNESFVTGDITAHKNGSRYWIKDKCPIVECDIGFAMTYRDPSGCRGEFWGFVAVVNKQMSEKFLHLVTNANTLIKTLPWNDQFEKDTFLKPDFTSLDVLTFAGSGVPAGISIPPYDEIRQNEGFKNVSLGNVLSARNPFEVFAFVCDSDQELLRKYKGPAFELQVGLHELFGHGTGKLFRRNEDNTFNFDKNTVVNPLNNEKINQWYEPGETFDLKFKALASTYEEARAEAVGLYLSLNKEISKIFGHLDETIIEDLIYVNWLSLIQKGVVALEFYNPQHKNWLQAHAQARFVIMKVLVEAGEDLLSVEETVSNENLLIKLDRSKIFSVGKRAIKEFLLKLQVYKSMGDIEKASKFYNYYATVNEDGPQPWLRWREIVLKHKQPRIIFVQANTQIGKDNTVELLTYEPTLKGFLHSWKNRFPDTKVDDILENLWTADKHYFAKH